MIISYINQILNKYKQKHHNNSRVYLKDNIKIFTYIASAISKKNIDILESPDEFGGYFKNTIILPKEIALFKNNQNNYIYYLYKIIFFVYLNQLNLNKKYKIIYLILSFILTIKKSRKNIKTDYLNIIHLEKIIYSKIKNTNSNITSCRYILLKIIIDKITYNNTQTLQLLTLKEKEYLYKLENLINIKNNNIVHIINKACKSLRMLYAINDSITLYHPWGYFYYNDKKKSNRYNFKTQLEQRKKHQLLQRLVNSKKKNVVNNKNILPHFFDYKKTIDKYNKNNNKSLNNTDGSEVQYLNSTNIQTIIEHTSNSQYIIKNDILNNVCLSYQTITNEFKKYEYDEWDFNLNAYKKNWCKIFEKKTQIQHNQTYSADFIKKHLSIYKNLILFIRKKILSIKNQKTWIKKQKYGHDIDIDTLIDNYSYVKDFNFENIYKYKKNITNDISIILLLDSSLSTDNNLINKKHIFFIKILTLILSLSLEKIIPYEISTFYSNTRHDCRYIKLKDFSDTINKKMYALTTLVSHGYTRIGPAIRHATKLLTKRQEKQKIILLLTDGYPTDYDEYEGFYGIKDIKTAITETLIKRIKVKTLVITNQPNTSFLKILDKKNYFVTTNISYKNLMTILSIIF
ncbi:MAG TPA: VWA domain-containing protein [Candidatus Azoamicus sp. OHIO2]